MTTNGFLRSSGPSLEHRFASIYNDTETYPTLQSVADALKRSKKTVRNYAALLRQRAEAGEPVPPLLVERSTVAERHVQAPEEEKLDLTPQEHAHRRAAALTHDVRRLLTSSAYPVVNPEAIVIESHVTTRYDRLTGRSTETESTPRTWISDTLRASPVPRPANRRFIFTGAQNDCPVDVRFWENLLAYGDEIGAEVIVGPWTYETTWWSENTPSSREYDPRIRQHLCFGQMEIGDRFVFCGEMNTLPTANKPISDLQGYSRGRWAVFPHAKLQLVSVPASNPLEQAFQIMTTGAVTRPRVIPRKAGVKSIFHHQLGATLVEFDQDGDLFCRQLLAAEDGSFQDLDAQVRNGLVTYGHRVTVMTPGDIHVAKIDPRNALATFGYEPRRETRARGSMLEVLRPEVLTLHDLHDHESRNHHHAKDVSHNFEMAHRGREAIMDELGVAADFLIGIGRPDTKILVIDSNHDLALERYVREGRYRMDGVNYRFGLAMDVAYHDWRAEVADALDTGRQPRPFSLLEWALRHLAGEKIGSVEWVYDGHSRVVGGVQLGYHGFRGANGAKGTVTGYARLGHPVTIGDKHSPSIMDGVYGAGVMQLQQGYNKGPSGWAVSHVLQYPNGQRTIVTLQNGKWRAQL